MLVTLRGQTVHCRKGIISGSFYLLFFILSAARAILVSSLSELLKYKKHLILENIKIK